MIYRVFSELKMSARSEKAPGFKIESIDVYETSDLPEADQHLLSNFDNETTDTVEILPITANEAFGRFKGAYIDSKAVDFSDKLRQDRRQGRMLDSLIDIVLT